MLARFRPLADASVQLGQAVVAARDERLEAVLAGERKSLDVMRFRGLRFAEIAPRGDFAQQEPSPGAQAVLAALARECGGTLGMREGFLERARAHESFREPHGEARVVKRQPARLEV